MAIKTFNIDEKIYKEYLKHCKKEGISMSRKVENFIKAELEKLSKLALGKLSAHSHQLKSEPETEHSLFYT